MNILERAEAAVRRALGDKPRNVLLLTFAILFRMTSAERSLLNAVERELGEEGANEWLCDILVSTGHYEHDGAGYVRPVRRSA